MSDWKQQARERLGIREEELFEKRSELEAIIDKVIGREVSPSDFLKLRNLFGDWEATEEALGKVQDRFSEYI